MKVALKLQTVRNELQKVSLKKSGKNKHIGFNYFELTDFIPQTMKLFEEHGLFSKFDMFDTNATLTIYDVESGDHLIFNTTRAEATLVKATPVQQLGAEHTYIKRYLYVNALELSENDVVDQVLGDKEQQPKTEEKCTKEQAAQLRKLLGVERVAKMLEHYKIGAVSDLTVEQASSVIERETKKQND